MHTRRIFSQRVLAVWVCEMQDFWRSSSQWLAAMEPLHSLVCIVEEIQCWLCGLREHAEGNAMRCASSHPSASTRLPYCGIMNTHVSVCANSAYPCLARAHHTHTHQPPHTRTTPGAVRQACSRGQPAALRLYRNPPGSCLVLERALFLVAHAFEPHPYQRGPLAFLPAIALWPPSGPQQSFVFPLCD